MQLRRVYFSTTRSTFCDISNRNNLAHDAGSGSAYTRFYERVNGAPPPNSARARVICIRKAKNGINKCADVPARAHEFITTFLIKLLREIRLIFAWQQCV